MEYAKCILCEHNAERYVFKDPEETSEFAVGQKYKCPECGLSYAFGSSVHSWLEEFGTKKHKEKLSEYIKNNPDEKGGFKWLKRTEVEKILNVTIPEIKWHRLR